MFIFMISTSGSMLRKDHKLTHAGEKRDQYVVPVECKMKPLHKSTERMRCEKRAPDVGRAVGYDDKNRPSRGISTEDIKKMMTVDRAKLHG